MFGRCFSTFFAVAVLLSSAVPAAAEDRLFGDLSTESLPSLQSRGSWDAPLPRHFRALEVDIDVLESLLLRAPVEGSAAAAELVIALPYPDGTDQRFRIEESPILEPELAAGFPEIRTFVAKGIDDPTATARLSLTSLGFHALVLSASGTVFIDPYRRWDARYALSYFKQDAVKPPGEVFLCDAMNENPEENLVEEALPIPTGMVLRTYRLALAGTGEYSASVCAPNPVGVSCALNAMVVSMNRVNAIFEREVAVRMVLIAANDRIVYTNGGTDPYDNSDKRAMLGQNQANLDSVIGTANYDIGHVLSTVGGGVANLRSACTANKARGVSGKSDHVDVVTHEMGHQLGASHSFNGTTGSCNGNRMAEGAYEPGSGSTIMSYAGLCGAENLQQHSDDTFHTKNFDEMVTFTTGAIGNSCAGITATGNRPPSVNAGPAFTIPKLTPFTLTGSATDLDRDALTYMWEELDRGTASPPHSDFDAERPIFRSFVPLTEPSRTFPRLWDILNSFQTRGESMSTRTRTMTFRLTVRDNRAGGGGVSWAATTVTVNAAAGPFAVTQPHNPLLIWAIGSSQTVTWNVAGTTAAPVSCANVAIHLSTDGGYTFPTVLAASTPNDGTERVTIPNTPTTKARVRVSCVGNVFFDISNFDFTIALAPTLTSINPTIGEGDGGTRVTLTGTNFVNGTTVLFGGVPATSVTFNGATSLTAQTPGHSAGAVDVTVTNPNTLSATLSRGFTYLPPTLFQLPPTVNTSASPSAISLERTTYVFYKGSGNDPGIYVTSSNRSIYPGSWAMKRLPLAINTSAAPSVALKGLEIYVAYKGAGGDTNIYVARSLDATATWTMTRFPMAVNTSTGPNAFFYAGSLYVFYKGSGNDQRMYVARLSDDTIWTPAPDEAGPMVFKTRGNDTVPGVTGFAGSPGYAFPLPPTVNTSASPSAIVPPFAQAYPPPHVFYKGSGDDPGIYVTVSNGGWIDPAGSWTMRRLPSAIGTSAAPSVVVKIPGVYVVYKGAGNDPAIYVARSLDATATWAMTKFPATVNTSTGPTAFAFERGLYVFYKGSGNDERMYVAQLPDNAIWTPLPQAPNP